MTVKEIIEKWLRAYHYDGLYSEGGCACSLDSLFLCAEADMIYSNCKAGYKTGIGCGGWENPYHIGPEKPKEKLNA